MHISSHVVRQAPSMGGPSLPPEALEIYKMSWLRPNMASVYVVGPLWGLLVALSYMSVRALCKQPNWTRSSPRILQLTFVLIMTAISTAAFGLVMDFEMSLFVRNDSIPGALTPRVVSIMTLTIVQQFLLDGLLVYRVWLIYNSIWYFIPGLLTFFGAVGTGIYLDYIQLRNTGSLFNFDIDSFRASVSYGSITVAHTCLCSGLILARIISVAGTPSRLLGYRRTISMVIESGLIYCAYVIMLIVFTVQRNPALWSGIVCFPHLGACVFCGIVLQSHKKSSPSTSDESYSGNSSTMKSSNDYKRSKGSLPDSIRMMALSKQHPNPTVSTLVNSVRPGHGEDPGDWKAMPIIVPASDKESEYVDADSVIEVSRLSPA